MRKKDDVKMVLVRMKSTDYASVHEPRDREVSVLGPTQRKHSQSGKPREKLMRRTAEVSRLSRLLSLYPPSDILNISMQAQLWSHLEDQLQSMGQPVTLSEFSDLLFCISDMK